MKRELKKMQVKSLSKNELQLINGGKSLRQWLDELMSGNATFWY